MSGLDWSYDDLIDFLTRARRSVSDVNPLVQHVLLACPGSTISGVGADSVVIDLASEIVAKVALKEAVTNTDKDQIHNEQNILSMLKEQEPPCPFLVQCYGFFAEDHSAVTFLERVSGGGLYDRIMSKGSLARPIVQWMLQLASAAAHLESLGYAHGDIWPRNILIDSHEELRLVDFGYTLRAGSDVDVGYEPYVRQKRGQTGGQYGTAGAVTEQFALGSVFWFIHRGTELYAEVDGATQVNRLIDGVFPETDPADPIEQIIGRCWREHYATVADLVDDIRQLPGAEAYPQMQAEALQRRKERHERCEKVCQELYKKIKSTPGPKQDTTE